MRRLKEKLVQFLEQGMTPHDLALALALGMSLGTFPVVGATSLLCTLASMLLRLNFPVIQSVNWAVSPLQLMLLIPFMELGTVLFGGNGMNVNLTDLVAMMQNDLVGTVGRFLAVTLHAIGAWALVAVPVAALTYLTALPLISRVRMQSIRVRVEDGIEQQQQYER